MDWCGVRSSYGDVLAIDAGQKLTRTEHILAIPAGTQAVTGFKAYVSAARDRRAIYLVSPNLAERRETAACCPLDPRPVRG